MNNATYDRLVAEAKAFADEIVISPKDDEEFLAMFGQRLVQLYAKPPEMEEKLTAREIQLLREMKKGRTYGQAAAQLNISRLTVKETLVRIRGKLGATNTVDAVNRATSYGLV